MVFILYMNKLVLDSARTEHYNKNVNSAQLEHHWKRGNTMKKTGEELAKSKRLSNAVEELNLGIDLADSLGKIVDVKNLGLCLMLQAAYVLETMASIRTSPEQEERSGKYAG